MITIKVKSRYGDSKARGISVNGFSEMLDPQTLRRSVEIYEDAVKKMRGVRIGNPHISEQARRSDWLVQVEPKGKWFEALFNGTRLSWIEKGE